MARVYDQYHPYRFSRLAKALSDRVTRVADQISADISIKEYQGMGDIEFHTRMNNYRVLIETHSKWTSGGRQIFDMSTILAPLAGASENAISELPSLRLADTFYIHFGAEAGISAGYDNELFVDGAYFEHDVVDGQPGYRFVIAASSDKSDAAPSVGELLRSQTRVAIGFTSVNRSFRDSYVNVVGDPLICDEGLAEALVQRIELSLAYAANPDIQVDIEREINVGCMPQGGRRH